MDVVGASVVDVGAAVVDGADEVRASVVEVVEESVVDVV